MFEAGTWPEGWDGDEPLGDTVLPVVYQNGWVQPVLFLNHL